MALAVKQCTVCGKDFRPVVGNQKKCSVCRYKKKTAKKPVERVCYCGKAFASVLYNKKYCSKECRDAANYQPDRKEKICGMCGRVFFTTTDNKKYCSPSCAKISFHRSLHKYYEKNKHNKKIVQQETNP